MKKFLSIVAMCLASLSVMAQSSLVATLTHEGATTEYYGITAFANAVAASADGDLITLSTGVFNGASINKSLNIRGTGTTPAEQATSINTEVVIDKSADPDESKHWLNFEGINFDCQITFVKPLNKTDLYEIKDLQFKRCIIKNVGYKDYYSNGYYYATLRNCRLINCYVRENFYAQNESEISFINSVVFGYSAGSDSRGTNAKGNSLNSVLITNNNPKALGYMSGHNSIFVFNAPTASDHWNNYYLFPTTSSLDHCIFTGRFNEVEADMANLTAPQYVTNCQYKPMSDVFESATSYTAIEMDNDYALTAGAQSILGTDGTQLGIYGGAAPYSAIVTYPRFTTFTVGEKAVDGKLSVSVSTTE